MTPAPSQPLVSCLMVTRDRPDLSRRAVECLARQTYPHVELVVIDDGDVSYEAMLAPYRARFPIAYHRMLNDGGLKLGGLRNLLLDRAHGDVCVQWDDDEWYHPERIAAQLEVLLENKLHAVVLRHTLMHLDTPEFLERPFRTALTYGTPGTVLHRKTAVRYPNRGKGEDTVFLRRLFVEGHGRVRALGRSSSHLFIRCFHGKNTWDAEHFTERLSRGPRNWMSALYAKHVRKDLFAHRLFQLDVRERAAFSAFLEMSRELGTLQSDTRAAPGLARDGTEGSVEQRKDAPPHAVKVRVR